MAKNDSRGPAPVSPEAAEIARLKADNARLTKQLAVKAGSGVVVPEKPREEILDGKHHWKWEGYGALFLGSSAGPNGEPAVQRSGDVVSEEFALAEIAAGGESSKYLVPYEGEAEVNEPTPDTSPNANLPRPQAHDRAVTTRPKATGAAQSAAA